MDERKIGAEERGMDIEVGDEVRKVGAFSSPEPFSLGHSLKIRLWVRRLKEEI